MKKPDNLTNEEWEILEKHIDEEFEKKLKGNPDPNLELVDLFDIKEIENKQWGWATYKLLDQLAVFFENYLDEPHEYSVDDFSYQLQCVKNAKKKYQIEWENQIR